MTHSLHRAGTAANLQNDFVVFAISAQTVNARGSAAQFARFFEIVSRYNPVNMGDMKTGNIFSAGKEAIQKGYQDNSIVHAVFTDKEILPKVFKELRDANLGPSIVVSGLLHDVNEGCEAAGIKRHTIEHSLGVWGRTEKLPSQGILEVATMCGHGMVAFNLVKEMIDQIQGGRKTPREAALELARQCHCGIVNPVRAEQLLKALAARGRHEVA